jgi:hypothetical protein
MQPGLGCLSAKFATGFKNLTGTPPSVHTAPSRDFKPLTLLGFGGAGRNLLLSTTIQQQNRPKVGFVVSGP